MTIYEKPHAQPFADDAPPSEIKPFGAWLRGLGIAFDETNGFPEMEGFNGLLQALSIYIKYLEQNGFAEWRPDLEYPIGAGVRVGAIWYRARRQNTNKSPNLSQNDWELFLNASALSYAEPIYIEGNTVKIRDATTSKSGVIRYATNAEAQAGSKVNAAITPDQAMLTSFGFGQKWQDMTSSRNLRDTYRNTTTKPIMVTISAQGEFSFYVDDALIVKNGADAWTSGVVNPYSHIAVIVPPGSTYKLGPWTNYITSTLKWMELR